MVKTDKGLEIVKIADSTVRGQRVVLTRKTTKSGKIRHGVVLEDKLRGWHKLIGSFEGIAPAFKAYKALVAE